MAYLYLDDLDKELDELNDLFDETGGHLDDETEDERRTALIALADQLGGTLSSMDGDGTLIPTFEFEDYAQELAYDVGCVERDSQMESYIDWERWARDVQLDYTSVEFDGTTYLIRQG